MAHPEKKQRWFVYILECGDGTLYTGATSDVAARLACHQAGAGARYTRGRKPLRLLYTEACRGKSKALKREYAIKKLSRDEKLALIKEKVIK
jgi:predicted GIY-YIG superfamily endonuclease